MRWLNRPSLVSAIIIVTMLSVGKYSSATAQNVALVVEGPMAPPAEHGLDVLTKALQARGLFVQRLTRIEPDAAEFWIVAGVAPDHQTVVDRLSVLNSPRPAGPQALVVQRAAIEGKPALIICGSDACGLMYAGLDIADRISWSEDPADPFAHVQNAREKPYVRERAVSMYTMQRTYFESRLYDESYWQKYFDMLARNRINGFVVIFGYENGGFMAPPYPYFFDVPEFPGVKLIGITPEQQKRNVKAFKRMIEIAHSRGIEFTAGIWDHIYRGGVQGGGIVGASEQAGKKVEGLVWGVTAENLASYNKAALRQFLEVFPEIDALQLRMHGESGLRRGEMGRFWHEVFGMIKQMRPTIRVDTRAKELPDAIIDDGLAQGLRLRVATKYWMEQMGLPFHPTHVNPQNQHDRRHGYADLLRYPQRYRVHWRLWNGGTTRFLLWGDPEYVRRFAESTRVYDSDSFEVNEMLATKMLGEPHETKVFDLLTPAYRYYDHEFERYWHFYQVWGRVGYNPDTPREIWKREFQRRFGPEAGPALMKALHCASKVLPRIVAASYPYRYFPTTRGWAEMMRMNDLSSFAEAEGSDVQQFMNMRDHARSIIAGTDTAMRRPTETSTWLQRTSDEIFSNVNRAEGEIGQARNAEFISTITDLRILANLADYHAHRLNAGVHYNLFKLTGDLFAFDAALACESQAVEAWQRIVQVASDVYSENLAFGVQRVGFSRHWEEELDKLRNDLEKLRQERGGAHLRLEGEAPRIAHVPLRYSNPHQPPPICATVDSDAPLIEVRVGFSSEKGKWDFVEMQETGQWQYQAAVPMMEAGEVRYFIEAKDSQGRVQCIPSTGEDRPFVVTVTADHEPPQVALGRPEQASPGKGLEVTADVWDPSGIKSVRLRYRHMTQFEDYQTEEMLRNPDTGLWSAVIPESFVDPKWDLMYFVEAIDKVGNGKMYPDMETEIPYVIVGVEGR
ncbi:MAG: hypothetical protein JSW27_17385 [Phycisphaerales bacterium]|nr:MAG: hypothetical protein JSW27_17385 [Phycisphaerales bacterium]